MTTSGVDSIRCPHCGCYNDNVCLGSGFASGQKGVFQKNCVNISCKKEITFEIIKWLPELKAYSIVPIHIQMQYDEAKKRQEKLASEPAPIIPSL